MTHALFIIEIKNLNKNPIPGLEKVFFSSEKYVQSFNYETAEQ